MSVRDEAYEDYKNGLKYKEIAEKYGVSISTVKSWKSRYWKTEKVATKSNKRLQPKSKKVATKKPGGQKNNKNAFGHGAPENNTNALNHGGYSAIYWDTLDEDEQEMIDDMDSDEETQLVEQLKLYAIRERRLLKAIKKVKSNANKTDDVEISSSVFFNFENKEKTVITDEGDVETQTVTKPKPSGTRKDYEKSEFAVSRLEKELTSIQRSKTKVINSLAELRRLKGDNSDEWLNDFFDIVDEVEDEV